MFFLTLIDEKATINLNDQQTVVLSAILEIMFPQSQKNQPLMFDVENFTNAMAKPVDSQSEEDRYISPLQKLYMALNDNKTQQLWSANPEELKLTKPLRPVVKRSEEKAEQDLIAQLLSMNAPHVENIKTPEMDFNETIQLLIFLHRSVAVANGAARDLSEFIKAEKTKDISDKASSRPGLKLVK